MSDDVRYIAAIAEAQGACERAAARETKAQDAWNEIDRLRDEHRAWLLLTEQRENAARALDEATATLERAHAVLEAARVRKERAARLTAKYGADPDLAALVDDNCDLQAELADVLRALDER